MEGGWLISYVALWCLTGLLVVVVLAHSRLLGQLHYRLRPAGARALLDGPELGARISPLRAWRLDGSPWTWDFPADGDLLLVFVSPQCQTCNELMPHVKDFVRAHPDVPLVLLSTLDDLPMNRAYVGYRRLERLTYVVNPELADVLRVDGTPYALRINRAGVVTAKGIVNHYEHLQSLKDASAAPEPSPPGAAEETGARTGSLS